MWDYWEKEKFDFFFVKKKMLELKCFKKNSFENWDNFVYNRVFLWNISGNKFKKKQESQKKKRVGNE